MIYCVSHSIISPLGEGSEVNYQAVLDGKSAMRLYTDRFANVEPFYASLFEQQQQFVSLINSAARQALLKADIDASADDVVFILSTTKGDNLHLLAPAQALARCFSNKNTPIVVSNACTSGVCAQITAMRLLKCGRFHHAVVVGCDLQTRFIVSGFQSLKALSAEQCRPFDSQRQGLNLGEAAAAIVYSNCKPTGVRIEKGSIHNDANHISGPSRTADGLYCCLTDMMDDISKEDIDFVSVHGTATLYNDEMESIALHRASLDAVPICALKGYYGHTMGAAGVLETIIGILAIEQGFLPAAKGYNSCGTLYPMNISQSVRAINTKKGRFIKILSGFGGVNAAIRIVCE